MPLDDKDGKVTLEKTYRLLGPCWETTCQNGSALRGFQGPRLLLHVSLTSLECRSPLRGPG